MPVAAGKIYPGHTVAHVFLANCADPVCLVYQTCLDDHNVADSVYDSVLDLKWPKQDFLGRDKKVEWKNFQKCCNKSLISRKFPMSSTLLSCRSIQTRSDEHLIYLSCINPLLYIRLWEQRKCKQFIMNWEVFVQKTPLTNNRHRKDVYPMKTNNQVLPCLSLNWTNPPCLVS